VKRKRKEKETMKNDEKQKEKWSFIVNELECMHIEYCG